MRFNRKLLLTTCVLLAVFMFIPPQLSVVHSQTLDEIQAQIAAENAKLAALQAQLDAAQKNVSNLQSQIGSAQGTIPGLQAQIDQITATIEFNNLQMQKLAQEQAIKELEADKREKQQDRALKNSYLHWRTDSKFSAYLLQEGRTHPLKKDVYQSVVMDKEKISIDELAAQIDGIKDDLANFQTQTGDLQKQNEELAAKKSQLEAQIQALQFSLSGANGQVAGLKAESNVVQSTISQLSAQQKALQDYEAWILGQNSNGGTNGIASGQIYFTGKGRDLYQGHGVGMSQFGAYGGANAGMSAAQIISFYYTGVQVGTSSGTINVEGYGAMDLDTYAAGQGEVPGKACGTHEQAVARPDKYVENTGNFWACWPEEAIKAQVIAFRSYALYQMINYGGSICTDARCQVYNGSQYTRWAADETHNQVAVYNGNVIQALYSSDNSNGIGGTANNETRFSDFAGNGSVIPYLRSVNDTGFATQSSWTNWNYRTNGYSMGSITQMIQFAAQDPELTWDAKAYMSGVRDTVGSVAAVNFQRDPSQRAAKVVLTGTNGVSVNIAGWFFKGVWNSWIDQVMPTGQKDFIYSQTYFLITCTNGGGC